MPRTIRYVEHRVTILKMLLEIFRTYCGAYFPGKPFASCSDDLLLVAAIFIGQAEKRPMNPSKLSDFAGMPRPTVIRKLKSLETIGVLEVHEGAYKVRPVKANGNSQLAAVRLSHKLIVTAAAKLSKMDT